MYISLEVHNDVHMNQTRRKVFITTENCPVIVRNEFI